ncbi:hypothetical protein BCR34DRAFT_326478 [Clohesyomyces aquaticus]|uniref:Uncharacterized protein n=1 Tax=Clohesyomyces aquaticus TaxID=1231657 RepID=A0A1Y1ZMK7_9PLEO|nr:hypothetical protein BCR34DRAFT_326478 [Clohesyomyces aquaticus]
MKHWGDKHSICNTIWQKTNKSQIRVKICTLQVSRIDRRCILIVASFRIATSVAWLASTIASTSSKPRSKFGDGSIAPGPMQMVAEWSLKWRRRWQTASLGWHESFATTLSRCSGHVCRRSSPKNFWHEAVAGRGRRKPDFKVSC